jgi:hypothetical protein
LVEAVQVWGWLKINWGSVLFALFMLILAAGIALVLANVTDIAPLIHEFFS